MVGDDVVSKNNRVKKILADGGHDSKDNFGGPINLSMATPCYAYLQIGSTSF